MLVHLRNGFSDTAYISLHENTHGPFGGSDGNKSVPALGPIAPAYPAPTVSYGINRLVATMYFCTNILRVTYSFVLLTISWSCLCLFVFVLRQLFALYFCLFFNSFGLFGSLSDYIFFCLFVRPFVRIHFTPLSVVFVRYDL